jgi:hypothetical protein
MSNLIVYNKSLEYTEFYIKVNSNLFFTKIGWDNLEVEKNFILVSVDLNFGNLGIEGDFSIGIPPVNEDINDQMEYGRKKGCWDWYLAYSFNIKLNDNKNENLTLQIYNALYTLFDLKGLEIKCEFNLNKYNDLNILKLLSKSNIHTGNSQQIFESTINEFMKILKIEFDAELVEKPKDQII